MARTTKHKNLKNSRLLKEYASWIYCTSCNQTVAYLCYVTYDMFDFEYTCTCGSRGSVYIEFEHDMPTKSDIALQTIKNRLCCPTDDAPLFTVVEKNVESYKYRIVCNGCGSEYSGNKKS